ncbi:MAG TPA: hypothetical protein VFF27_00265 [Bacteroidia bacterium]|nr:hypothetical protein [Bacteroidia bacterium]
MHPVPKHIYIIFSLALLALILWRWTEPKEVVHTHTIQDKIVTEEKEVVKWKAQKEKIIYTTKFDTIVTKEIIYRELLKCDSIVKIDSSIIAGQDTIIADQKELIALSEKEVKKQKRKLVFTKVVAGAVIVATILLVK